MTIIEKSTKKRKRMIFSSCNATQSQVPYSSTSKSTFPSVMYSTASVAIDQHLSWQRLHHRRRISDSTTAPISSKWMTTKQSLAATSSLLLPPPAPEPAPAPAPAPLYQTKKSFFDSEETVLNNSSIVVKCQHRLPTYHLPSSSSSSDQHLLASVTKSKLINMSQNRRLTEERILFGKTNSNRSCRNATTSCSLAIFAVITVLVLLHQIDLCNSHLSYSQPPPPPPSSSAAQQQQSTSLPAVLSSISSSSSSSSAELSLPLSAGGESSSNRVVRSYSEEFMSSSEERERGLQFFGGTSAASSGSSGFGLSRHRIAPYFDTESLSTNVTISEGSPFVHLPCRVKQLADRTLSWIRRADLQILTVGKFTYTSDQRFQAIHLDNSDDWSLQISYPKKKDAGTYECQVATMPKMSLFIQLNVVVSKAKILEGPTLYLSSGSTLNLTCVVRDTPEPPDYIFWYYNGQVINYGSPRGIKVTTEKSSQTLSKLAISRVQPNDSGNYSCTPSNAESAHIAVHVHNNANPAASIQHGKRSAREFGNSGSTLSKPHSSLATTVTIVACLVAVMLSNTIIDRHYLRTRIR